MAELVVIGDGGMLGRAWSTLLAASDSSWAGVHRPAIDLFDEGSIRDSIAPGTRWVINCAAWTGVDLAETHEDEATTVNGTAVGWLAKRCQELDASLVHYSTDYVFDGMATTPYPTGHPRAPIGAYGRGKALGEELLEASGAPYLLVRTSWLYAPWGKNFVRTIAGAAHQGKSLRIVDDQRGTPSSAASVAAATFALMQQNELGTFHITDGGECTWYELGKAIAEAVNPECLVEPCPSSERSDPAPRPSYSVLDTSRTEALLGSFRGWRHELKPVVEEIRATLENDS